MSHQDTVATLAILPGVGDRVRRYALEACSITSGAKGMGASGEATLEDKKRLTAQAKGIFEFSKQAGAPGVADVLRGQIQYAFAELTNYGSWTDSSWFNSYDSSQTVRANLQQALANVSIATGVTSQGEAVSSTWRPQTKAAKDVSIWTETTRNLPGEVKQQASNIANAPSKTVCEALGGTWDEASGTCSGTERLKKILIAAALGLLAVGTGYVVISNYARGWGARANNPGRGRRPNSTPNPLRRLRSGSPGRAA